MRVLYITLAHTYRLRPTGSHFQFGYEMGRIARALVSGYGYANPFHGHTGPTTWVAPLYPLLLAGVFKLFGVYTLRSAWVILTANSFFSALTALSTYEIAARCFNRRVAWWSAWIWALYPAAMQYAVRWVWETSLSTWLFSCIIVVALRMRRVGEVPGYPSEGKPLEKDRGAEATLRQWLLFGFLWGMVALSNPSLMLFLPASGLWVILGARNPRKQFLRAAASTGIFLLCLSPWIARNASVFHRFIPVRANFGAELYLGNGPGARGFLMEYNHPYEAPDQLRLYRQMGEVAYARLRGWLAMNCIARDPWLFARNSFKRVYFFWISVPHPTGNAWYVEPVRVANFAFGSIAGLFGLALALKRRVPGACLFAWAFLLVPAIYYFVAAAARFRHPLEPLIVVLAVYLFQSAGKTRCFSIFGPKPVDAIRQTPVFLEG
ncbi:MAG: hypothetical protein ABI064_07830 [Acidobacteriaceae bacterium]